MKAGLALLALALAGCGGTAGAPAPISAAASDGVPLGALPRQALGAGECGLFLWKTGVAARLILMAKAGPPPFARILLDGRLVDLPRLPGGGGTPEQAARYGDGDLTIAMDVTVEPRDGLSNGGLVPAGSIRIDRVNGDGLIVPVTGLLACG